MPQVIPAVVTYFVGNTVAAAVISVALQTLVIRALTKTPKSGGQPINVSVRSTIAARQIILGTCRASGAFLDYGCYGSGNKFLVYVIAFAGHQTNDALDGYLDKYKVAAAYINNGTGAVTDPAFDGKLTWYTHRGTGAQTADSFLTTNMPGWTSNHRCRGISYDVLKMERSDKAWPNGAPQNVGRVLQGALLYDPRLDTTVGGSGTHRADDPSTWAFSNNMALGLRWYLSGGSVVNDQSTCMKRYGLGEADARFPAAHWIAQANKCDESISGANAPPSGAQARYTLDIELSCEQTHRDCIEAILACGAAELSERRGNWYLYVAQYDATSHDFTQDDLHGDLQVDDTAGAENRLNALSGVYIDAARDYTEQTSVIWTDAAYVTQDGGEDISEEIPLRGCNNEYRAQRLTKIQLGRSRQMRTIKACFGRQGLKVAIGETFTFSHTKFGWSGKVFRCIEREPMRDDDGVVMALITARAESSSVYTDPLTADYLTGTSVTNALQSEAPDAPTALTATAMPRAIEFAWTVSEFWRQFGVVELIEHTASTPASSGTVIWRGRGERAVIQKTDSTIRYYWARVVAIGNQTSSTEPASTGLAAAAMREPDMIADGGFELATDNTYWQAYQFYFIASAATNVSIVNTGGVSGGVLSLTGDSSGKVVWNKRSTPYPVITGQNMRVRFRWRRTGTVNAANASDIIFLLQLATTDGAIPPASTVTAGGPFSGVLSKTRADVAAVNVNEWQEDEFTGVFVNVAKTNTQLPYAELTIQMDAACTSGTIQIDQVHAQII